MKYKTFITRYYFDGEWWGNNIQAYDWEEAEQRCKKLGLQLDGELKFTLYGPFGYIVAFLMDNF